MQAAAFRGPVFKFGLFEADVARNTLQRAGSPIKIQDQPYRVLIVLLEHAGEIVTREHLRKQLWADDTHVDFDGSLNVILKKLRAVLGDDSENPRFIQTVPRRGYRFIAPVKVEGAYGAQNLAQDAPVLVPREVADVLPAASRKRSPRWLQYCAIGGVAALILLLVLGWRMHPAVRPMRSAGPTAPPVKVRTSLAVLGFRNVSARPGDDWLTTAIAEMLSTELAAGDKLRLVSSEDVANLRLNSALPKTDTLDRKTTTRIGTALNSDLIVLGAYTTVTDSGGEHLRLDVRIQDAKSGEILTEVGDSARIQDLFSLVSRIGARLRSHLGLPGVEPSDRLGMLASMPESPEAARFYSTGLGKLRDFDYLAARELFAQAITVEPEFPFAYSMLARADMRLGYDDRAKAEAKRGLELSGHLPRTQRLQVEAVYDEDNGNWQKAADVYRVLFDLYPDDVDYGLDLAVAEGRTSAGQGLETIRQIRRLPEPLPDDPRVDLEEGLLTFNRDTSAADRLYRTAAAKALQQGKNLLYARAQELACFVNRQHLQSPPECQQAYDIFAAAGNRDEAAYCLQLMAEMQRLYGHEPDAVALYERAARMFEQTGDRERTGTALNNLSLVLEDEGQWAAAEANFARAHTNFVAAKDQRSIALTTSNIADIEIMRGHLDKADRMYVAAWQIWSPHSEYSHIEHAAMLLMQGRVADARAEIGPQVVSLQAYAGDPWKLAAALCVQGDIERAAGDFPKARADYSAAISTYKAANSSNATAQVSLANLLTDGGEAAKSEALARDAVARFENEHTVSGEIDADAALARALASEGKLSEAQEVIDHASHLADTREFPAVRLPLEVLRARIVGAHAGREQETVALEQLRRLAAQAESLGLNTVALEARLEYGTLELKLNPSLGRARLATLQKQAHRRGLEWLARRAQQAIAAPQPGLAPAHPSRAESQDRLALSR